MLRYEYQERRIEPHWTDDPAFESEEQHKQFMAGEIPHPTARNDNVIYIGSADGVSRYADRSNMSGEERQALRDHNVGEVSAANARSMHNWAKSHPDLAELIINARWGIKS